MHDSKASPLVPESHITPADFNNLNQLTSQIVPNRVNLCKYLASTLIHHQGVIFQFAFKSMLSTEFDPLLLKFGHVDSSFFSASV